MNKIPSVNLADFLSNDESRKQKSIKEMDKTDEKLKEVSAVLREKNTYLRNLERERFLNFSITVIT